MLARGIIFGQDLKNIYNKNSHYFFNSYIIILFAIFIASFFVQIHNYILTNSLDTSWMFTLNYASSNDFIFGKDIIFTFGPLGFLGYPITEGLTTTLLVLSYISKIIYLLYTAIIIYEMYESIKFIKSKELFLLIKYVLLPWLVIKMGFYVDYTIFIFLAIVHSAIISLADFDKPAGSLYSINRFKLFFIIFNAISSVILLFLKISFFPIVSVSVFLILISFLIFKKYVETFIYIFVLFTTFVLIYANFTVDLKGYFVSSIELITGYKKSMQIYEGEDYEKNFLVAIVTSLLFLILLYQIKHELLSFRQIAKLIIILLAFYYCFSYSFTRGSSSLFFRCSIVSVIVFTATSLTKNKEAKNSFYTLLILILSFGFFNYFYSDIFFSTNWNANQYNHAEKLPQKFLDSSKTYDVYPFSTSISYFNKLNYRPRPVFQSYYAYTPKLDSINANFISQKKADNIIFHSSIKDSLWENTIDGRYFLFEEPLTKMELLKKYMIHDEVNSALFITQKRKKDVNINLKLINKKSCSVDSPINLNLIDTTKLFFFTADFKYSNKANLASMVYKLPYISVELTTTDNKILKFTTVSDLLRHYCVLNKYCSNYYDYFSLFQRDKFDLLKNVKSIRFVSNKRGYLHDFDFSIFEASLY